MTPFEQTRYLFPKMPEKVFRLWLDGRIQANGWPPSGSAWQGALRGLPIRVWQRLEWHKQRITLDYNGLTAQTQRIVNEFIDAHCHGVVNAYSRNIPNSKQRLNAIVNYAKSERRLPSTLVFVEAKNALEIIDGCHRLAIFFGFQRRMGRDLPLPTEIEAWIGRVAGD